MLEEKTYGNYTAILPGCEAAVSYIYNHFDILEKDSVGNSRTGTITKNFLFRGFEDEINEFYHRFLREVEEGGDEDEF